LADLYQNQGSVKTYFLTLLTALWLLASPVVHAQKAKTKYKKSGSISLNDSLTAYTQSAIFDFPNLNKTNYYHNEQQRSNLKHYKDSGQDEKRYAALKEYFKNFAVQNFARDFDMLMSLAQLSRKYGPPGEAILLYKLVLKHYPRDYDPRHARAQFDTLNRRDVDLYVPMEQYYELVAFRKEIDTLRPPQGVLLNMGYGVNSEKEDYGPSIGNRDNVLIFTSKRNFLLEGSSKIFNEDLFYTVKTDTIWGFSEAFKNVNTPHNEGSACLSKDGKSLYFARCNAPGSHGNCDIYFAALKPDSTWGDIMNLGPTINSNAWDSQPSLSHSGDTLFFASDRIGGFGFSDIYYSVKDSQGKWQKALNLGPVVNTRGFEVSPFFHHKFNVLFFSSNGQPLNFGDFDIYKAYRLGTKWGEPKNIGPLVNGNGTEYYFTIDSESNTLYYARSAREDMKNLDLFSFPVPMEAQPEAIVSVKGTLVDSQTKQPMHGIVSIIDLDKGVEVAPKFLRDDGSFDFQLINKRNYLLIIQGEDFFRIEEIFFLDGDQEIHLETERIEPKLAFKSLEFENGKADILESMEEDLTKLANFMIDHPTVKVNISGHTDSAGREEANLLLSQARADAIKAYLVHRFKIDGARVNAHGYGSAKPIVTEKTDADMKLNRRVEFEIVH
jgi:outer membrane protein OmpA-like peptidoglycan-associated protein